ncbi:NADP-dependent oxidoreductase domain-containing protein [Leucosporidium creatinivorum]|uniref:NADP-dependent oxidoreductase domain-containing protein n=1 Tax=Leucosporidium creatinivorum TaxID=106004 RepID=A0A1Y2EQP1_9BASI|nr:NADP-dependent oxidoreductase domain-containing protein [Leucosporidium creatinivorum]
MVSSVQLDSFTLSRPGFGAMGLSEFYGVAPDVEKSKATLKKALEIGCTTFNTADIYGKGHNEELIGSFLAENPGARESIFLITKWGFKWGPDVQGFAFDGSQEYAAKAIDASIKRLGVTPDAWLVHRVDKTIPIEESVQAMEDARKAGKTKYIGISECSANTLRKASKVAKIDFIEIEYSPWTLDHEENGVLAAAAELGVIVLAYSPLGRGFLTGKYTTYEDFVKEGDVRANMPRYSKENFEDNLAIVRAFEKVAARKGCSSGQLSLAWLMAQGSNIVPIPGTKSEKYLIENFNSKDIVLDEGDLKELREIVKSHAPKGGRQTEAASKMYDNN